MMMHFTRPVRIASAVAAAMAGTLLCVSTAQSQLGAKVTITPPSPEADIKLLRQQLSELAGRVQQLEKKADDVKNNADDEAQARAIERRLSAVEQKETAVEAELHKKAAATEYSSGSHVQAPFIVFDKDGKIVFRVGPNAKYQTPEMVLGNEAGPHIQFAIGDDVSFARFYRSADRGGVQLLASTKESYVIVKKPDAEVTATMGTQSDNEFGLFLAHGDVNSARLVVRPSFAGHLTIMEPGGLMTVEAGTMAEGKGIVRTGPYCCKPPPAMGPHEFIQGRTH